MRVITDDRLATITIWQEAEDQPHEGKVAVGEVIRTRMRRKYTSDGTVAGTIAKRIQFSAWNDDKQNNWRLIASLRIDDTDEVVTDCINAWYASEHTDLTHGAVLYCRTDIDPRPPWYIESKRTVIIGDHSFFDD